MHIAEETDLTREAAAGSRSALAELLRNHEPRIERFVRSRIHRPEDADDCLQEIRLRITRSIGSFRAGEPFGPWARTIAANAIKNQFRDRKPVAALPEEMPAPGPGAPDRLIGKESALRVRGALRDLSARHREVIALRIDRGLSHRRVAAELSISEGAARVLFCRALAALRGAVGGDHAAP